MDALINFAILAAIVIFMVIRYRRMQEKNSNIEALPEQVAPLDAQFVTTPTLSDDDRLALEAAEVNSRWADERARVERLHSEEMEPIMLRLSRAKALVDKSGVGDSICFLFKTMRSWPLYSTRPDWVMPIDIEQFSGGETPNDKNVARPVVWLDWSWMQFQFRLEWARNTNWDGGTDTGNLKLSVNGELVLHLDVSEERVDDYGFREDYWKVYGVSAFKAGPWMTQVNELAGRLKILDRDFLRDHERKFYGEKAKNIELPEADI